MRITNYLSVPQTQNQADIASMAAEYYLGTVAGADLKQFNDEHRAALKHHGLKPASDKPLNLGLLDSRTYARVQNSLSAASITRGASLIPQGFLAGVEFAMFAKSAVRRTATVVRAPGNPVNLAGANTSSATGFIVRENQAAPSRQTPSFSQFVFDKTGFAAESAAPTSMPEDVPNWAEIIGRALGEGVGEIQNTSFTTTLTQMAPSVTAAGSNANGEDVEELISGIGSGHLSDDCQFMMSPSAFKAARKLKDGHGAYLYSRDSLRLAGYRVVLNEAMDATGTAGNVPIVFGDLSKFWIVDDDTMRIGPLLEPLAENNQTLWFALLRSAGVLVNPGSNPIVKLTLA